MTNQLIRPTSPALDAILGQTFPVLDDGFVRVVDYMGTDSSIVQAARVSYGDGTKKVSEDRALIRFTCCVTTTPLHLKCVFSSFTSGSRWIPGGSGFVIVPPVLTNTVPAIPSPLMAPR